jgi:hypothetical protein
MKKLSTLIDVLLSPFTLLASMVLWVNRKLGLQRQNLSKSIYRGVGIYPIRDHYYDPLFQVKELEDGKVRQLPGVDLNVKGQLALLASFKYQEELLGFPNQEPSGEKSYYYHNPAFGSGDAEFLYSIIRHAKPKKVVEIGSGFSTLMAQAAIQKNISEDKTYSCEHVCIEPYEMPWLEQLPVTVIRKRVEDIEMSYFSKLSANDILFIDSSHMIRRDSDVLVEYLRILPTLKKGVFVHVHDIFTPRDYPVSWLKDHFLLWNEQYLLEAFLTQNSQFAIVGALNFLQHDHPKVLHKALPVLAQEPGREPGSFWMQRV